MTSPTCLSLFRLMYKQSATSNESITMKRGDDDRPTDDRHDGGGDEDQPPLKRAKSASSEADDSREQLHRPPTADGSARTASSKLSLLEIARTAVKDGSPVLDSSLDARVAAGSTSIATTSSQNEGSDQGPSEGSALAKGATTATEAAPTAATASSLEEDIERGETVTVTFPERLMELLDQGVENESLWWLDDGDGFCVLPRLFADKILNVYFQGTKFESFTRKLNRWGFKRAAGHHIPTNALAYYHTQFQRGKPELLQHMRSGKKKDAFTLTPSQMGAGLHNPILPSSTAPLGTAFSFPHAGAGGSLLPSARSGGGVNHPLAFSGGTLLPGGGIYIPPHLVAAAAASSSGSSMPGASPLDADFQVQSFLASTSQHQQQAELLLQQQRARILAAQLANEQATAELRFRAHAASSNASLTSSPGSLDLASALFRASGQNVPSASLPPAPLAGSSAASGTGGVPPAYGSIDPVLLQFLLERQQRPPDGNPPR